MMPTLLLLQAGAIALPFDIGTVIWTGVLASLGVVGSAAVWLAKRAIAGNDESNRRVEAGLEGLGQKVDQLAKGHQAITQELIGYDGRNGIKGKQRDMERRMNRDSVVLIRLAAAAGVAVPELEDGD